MQQLNSEKNVSRSLFLTALKEACKHCFWCFLATVCCLDLPHLNFWTVAETERLMILVRGSRDGWLKFSEGQSYYPRLYRGCNFLFVSISDIKAITFRQNIHWSLALEMLIKQAFHSWKAWKGRKNVTFRMNF